MVAADWGKHWRWRWLRLIGQRLVETSSEMACGGMLARDIPRLVVPGNLHASVVLTRSTGKGGLQAVVVVRGRWATMGAAPAVNRCSCRCRNNDRIYIWRSCPGRLS